MAMKTTREPVYGTEPDFAPDTRTRLPIRYPDPISVMVSGCPGLHLKGCLLDLDHTGLCETEPQPAPDPEIERGTRPTVDGYYYRYSNRTSECPSIASSDFQGVHMGPGQVEVAKLLEIRFKGLADEILSLIPPTIFRDSALEYLLIAKMLAVQAVSRNPEVKL